MSCLDLHMMINILGPPFGGHLPVRLAIGQTFSCWPSSAAAETEGLLLGYTGYHLECTQDPASILNADIKVSLSEPASLTSQIQHRGSRSVLHEGCQRILMQSAARHARP